MNSSHLNTAAGTFLGIIFMLMTISIVAEGIYSSEKPETEGFAIAANEAPSGETTAPAEAAALEPISPMLAGASAEKGAAVFKKCAACHTAESGGANKVGPALWNIVNRPIASHEGFGYSSSMNAFAQGGSVVWDYEHLNGFLAAPKKYIPGTAMGFAGLKKVEERADLIAYLRSLADSPAPLPAP